VTGSREVVAAVLSEEAISATLQPAAERGFQIVAETRETLHSDHDARPSAGGQGTLRLTDCSGYPLLLGDASLGGRPSAGRGGRTRPRCPLTPVVAGNSIEVLKTIAASSQGICFQIGIRPETEPHLTAIPLTGRALKGRLVIGIKKNRQLPGAAAVFSKRCRTTCSRRGELDGPGQMTAAKNRSLRAEIGAIRARPGWD